MMGNSLTHCLPQQHGEGHLSPACQWEWCPLPCQAWSVPQGAAHACRHSAVGFRQSCFWRWGQPLNSATVWRHPHCPPGTLGVELFVCAILERFFWGVRGGMYIKLQILTHAQTCMLCRAVCAILETFFFSKTPQIILNYKFRVRCKHEWMNEWMNEKCSN